MGRNDRSEVNRFLSDDSKWQESLEMSKQATNAGRALDGEMKLAYSHEEYLKMEKAVYSSFVDYYKQHQWRILADNFENLLTHCGISTDTQWLNYLRNRNVPDGVKESVAATFFNCIQSGIDEERKLPETEEEIEFYLVKKQAQSGDSNAMLTLSKMYLQGYGCYKDKEDAFIWLKKAAMAGNAKAKHDLDELRRLSGLERPLRRKRTIKSNNEPEKEKSLQEEKKENDPKYWLKLGNDTRRAGNYQEAISHYKRAIELGSTEAKGALSGLERMLNQKRFQEEKRENDPKYWLKLGDDTRKAGNYQEAISHYKRAIELGSTEAKGALSSLERMLNQKNIKECIQRGDACKTNENYSNAIECYELEPPKPEHPPKSEPYPPKPESTPTPTPQTSTTNSTDPNNQTTSSNKKAFIGLVCVLLLLFFVAGNGNKSNDSSSLPSVQTTNASSPQVTDVEDTSYLDARTDLSLNGMDLGISLAEAQSKLGKPTKVEHLDNHDRHYYGDNFYISVMNNQVVALVTYAPKYKTLRGLHVGSTYDEVIDKYGTNSSDMTVDNLTLREYSFTTIDNEYALLRFAVDGSNRVDYISIRLVDPPALGYNWIKDGNGIYIWNPEPQEGESITWTGDYVKDDAYKYAEGSGTVTWYRDGQVIQVDEGTFSHGRHHGRFKHTFKSGNVKYSEWNHGEEIPDVNTQPGEYVGTYNSGMKVYIVPGTMHVSSDRRSCNVRIIAIADNGETTYLNYRIWQDGNSLQFSNSEGYSGLITPTMTVENKIWEIARSQ